MEIKHELFTQNYTKVLCEDKSEQKFNAPHHFSVVKADDPETLVGVVHCQEGPIKEYGINGVANEDLLLMVLTRLESFQDSPYKCEENERAIEHIKDAVRTLRERTNKRVAENKEGTSQI